MSAVLALASALAFLAPVPAQPGDPAIDRCAITAADKAANAQMSFDDFDQKGTTPTTWRQLSSRGCDAAAVEAAQDYLVHARFRTATEQRDVSFHLAQSLGMVGKYEAAALVVAATRDPGAQPPDLDWNSYVEGTWAFFVRDRAALTRARDLLLSQPGRPNQINGSVLGGLLSCFDQPYRIAYGTACRAGK